MSHPGNLIVRGRGFEDRIRVAAADVDTSVPADECAISLRAWEFVTRRGWVFRDEIGQFYWDVDAVVDGRFPGKGIRDER